jgi:hypothetical protein
MAEKGAEFAGFGHEEFLSRKFLDQSVAEVLGFPVKKRWSQKDLQEVYTAAVSVLQATLILFLIEHRRNHENNTKNIHFIARFCPASQRLSEKRHPQR